MYSEKLENKIMPHDFIFDVLERSRKDKVKVSFINPYSYSLISKENDIVNGFDYWFADGSTMCLMTNLFRSDADKISRGSFDFSSLAGPCFDFLQKNSLPVAIVGGEGSEVDLACRYFTEQYPNLNICYKHHGYINASNFENVMLGLSKSKPCALIVGMGTPKQETFILNAEKYLDHCQLFFTCGGFISQTAESGDYYHPIIKKFGLRWLQRAVLHKHVRRRLLLDYPKFYIKYLIGGSLTKVVMKKGN